MFNWVTLIKELRYFTHKYSLLTSVSLVRISSVLYNSVRKNSMNYLYNCIRKILKDKVQITDEQNKPKRTVLLWHIKKI